MSQRELEAPEDSIPLRLIVFSMTFICIASSLVFINTSWGVSILLVTLSLIGSIVAYQNRNERQSWMQWVVLVGVLAVGANALNEFLHPVNSAADFWGPVVHFVAGIFALHTFDLKSRSDINLSALLGAIILCALSPIVRGIYFGMVVFSYISLGCAMLYFDCMSRTQHNWLTKPMLPAPLVRSDRKRRRSGSTALTMAALPLTALVVFLFVPRSDNLIDVIVSSFKNFNFKGLMRLLPDLNKKTEVKKNPYDPNSLKKIDLPNKELKPDNGKKEEKKSTVKPGQADAPKPDAKKEEERKKQEKAKAEKEKAEEEKSKKAAAKPPLTEAEKKKAEKEAKEKAKKDAEKNARKDAEKNAKTDAAAAVQKLQEEARRKAEAEALKKAKEAAKNASKNAGKNAQNKQAQKGKDGAGKAKPKPLTPLTPAQKDALYRDFKPELFPSQLNVDARHSDRLSELILFRVMSTRIFYPRLSAYDTFDGSTWTRSKESLSHKIVEIKTDAGPNSKPVLRDGVQLDANGQPLKELSAEEEADLELAREKFFKEEKEEAGFGPAESVHYLISKSDKSQYDLKQAQPFRVPKKMPYVDLTQSYEILMDIGNDLPSCWIPQSLGFSGSTAVIDDYGRVSFPEPIGKGAQYKMSSSWPVSDLTAMREAEPLNPQDEAALREKLANYLQLPEGLDPAVKQFGDTAIGGVGNWFAQAEKLCLAVRANSSLSNEDLDKVPPAAAPPTQESDAASETAPTEEVASPPSDKVYDFLFGRKAGDSRRFATALAVLCRQQGLPCRVVNGFQSGTFNKVNGTYEIHGSDSLTWVEVYIPDYGWISFDATPDGVLPDQKREEGYNLGTLIKALNEQLGLDEGEGITPKKVFAVTTFALSCLIALAGIIYGVIVLLRYLKNRKESYPRGPEWPVYKALMKDLKKAQLERETTESGKQYVSKVGEISKERREQGGTMPDELPQALGDFFEVYEAMFFGNKGSKENLDELKNRAKRVSSLCKQVKFSRSGRGAKSSPHAASDKAKNAKKAKKDEDKSMQAVDSAVRRKR
ncbi:MAG: transglutaminase domain-containing protein [Candidatus Obscuribacter phosphatis]|uniref:Transglutaminase domain-containing protein n=1 Tax=Candidatus Obscuribacter phosphatis TaxID=1906157 RepID=A0A8J7TPD1_9BACT|nr:transglutaminase domain-containing protein [Candidatus Obscuribacter phosphatis]